MADNNERKLSESEKEAINSYLLKLFAFLGIPNLLFLIGAFVYLLFILPTYATQQAKTIMEAQMENLNKVLFDLAGKAITQASKAEERTDQAFERVNKLIDTAKNVEGNIKSATNTDLNKVGNILQTLEKNPDVGKMIELTGRISELETTRISRLENKVEALPYIYSWEKDFPAGDLKQGRNVKEFSFEGVLGKKVVAKKAFCQVIELKDGKPVGGDLYLHPQSSQILDDGKTIRVVFDSNGAGYMYRITGVVFAEKPF